MKFGIITLIGDNYGNKYQNYAVEQLLSQYGEVTSYALAPLFTPQSSAPNTVRSKYRLSYINAVLTARMMYQYDVTSTDKGVLWNLLYVLCHKNHLIARKKQRAERFAAFSKENLHISETVLDRINTGTEEFWNSKNFFICGSDQIWNPTYRTTSELAFCSFAPEKTICLSPSFGVSSIPEYRKKDFSEWIGNLRALSVREEAGQKIIAELTGRQAELLLDPTMALPIKQWKRLAKEPETALPKEYIACYFLGRVTKEYRKRIQHFAKQHKLPLVMLFDITQPDYYAFDPAEVLYTIKNAKYVLTDSFHGTVFSILFHKTFSVFLRDEGSVTMNSRLETLLKKFDLQERFWKDGCTDITPEQWVAVEQILDTERAHTNQYLYDAIQAGAGEHKEQVPDTPKVYSGFLIDNAKLVRSASGGAATAIAEEIIRQGGCVFGVAYTEDFHAAEYVCCETSEDLEQIKGSKFCETKKNLPLLVQKLKEGRTVLFIGLGCDVAAAHSYCKTKGISIEKLYTIDILCHGPVPAIVHRRFVEDLEEKYHSKVVSFTSRSKRDGWSSSSVMKISFENGKVFEGLFDETDYGYVFTRYAMPRCTSCRFKGCDHQGDICIGDHWGLSSKENGWNKNGVSILIEQSNRGKDLIEMLGEQFQITETDAQFALEHNLMYRKSRTAQLEMKQLNAELEHQGLHEVLSHSMEYTNWYRKKREIQMKRMVMKIIKR